MSGFDEGDGGTIAFGHKLDVRFVRRSRLPRETEHGRVARVLGVSSGFQVGHDPRVVHGRGSQHETDVAGTHSGREA
jgi:hypothetical protein